MVGGTANPNGTIVSSTEIRFDVTVDAVVAGTGAGGFSAALTIADHGARVLMLEKAAQVGGTTRKSGGWYWIPNNTQLRQAGLRDPKSDALRYMARLAAPITFDADSPTYGLPRWRFDLIEAFYDNASDAAQALERMGAIRPHHAVDIPDYFAELPQNRTPFGRVLQPTDDNGEPAMGERLIEGMHRAATAAGIDIRVGHRVRQVVVNGAGEVVGVLASRPDGSTLAVRARKGVVFATGGYAHNAELTAEFLAGPVFGSCAAAGSTGDFVQIGSDLGSPLRTMNHAWLAPMALEQVIQGPSEKMAMFAPPGDSMIFVNRFGNRVADEKAPYNEVVPVFGVWDPKRAEYPNLFLFMIWDAQTQRLYSSGGIGNPLDGDSHVLVADTFEGLRDELAKRLEKLRDVVHGFTLDDGFVERLSATVQRFNSFAEAGHDPDFHRGERAISAYFHAFNGPPRPGNDKNPLMYPISATGPYYATIVAPTTLDTKGGPITNRDAQLVNASGEPVPGIYGVGNCVASPSGRGYWGGGATIGPAITSGYLAAHHLVTQPDTQRK